jgi:hypothetical protein
MNLFDKAKEFFGKAVKEKGGGYNPTEEDRKFILQVLEDYEAAKAARKDDSDRWELYDEYDDGDQWDDYSDEEDEWKPLPVVNVCNSTSQVVHGNITSGKTSVSISARSGKITSEAAQAVSDMVDCYWESQDMDQKLDEAEWIRPKIGTVIFEVLWNPKLANGEGDLDTRVVHPLNFFPDPNVTNPYNLQECDFIDIAMPVSIRWLCRNLSKEVDPLCRLTAAQIKQYVQEEASFSDTEAYGSGKQSGINQRGRVLLHKYFYKDDKGNLQLGFVAGNVLLKHSIDDEDARVNGWYHHGRYSFVMIPFIFRDKRIWGRSLFHNLVGTEGRDQLQDIINRMVQTILINGELTGQGQVVVDYDRVRDPDKITGEAGLIIPAKGTPSDAVHRMAGQPLPEQFFRMLDFAILSVDRVTQTWDITKGKDSPTKTASGTIAITEQALKTIEDVIKAMNRGIAEVIELWLEFLAEFGVTEREYVKEKQGKPMPFSVVPRNLLLGADGQVPFGEAIPGEEGADPLDALEMDADTGEEETGESRRLHFKIKVDVGAGLALTKVYLYDLGLGLWKDKAIDIQGLYELLPDFPGKQDTLERMKEQEEMARQAAMGGTVPVQEEIPQEMEQPAVSEDELTLFYMQLQEQKPEVAAQIAALAPEEQGAALTELYQQAMAEQQGVMA